MAKRHTNITKLKIIQTALRLFLENGFSNTSARALCNDLDISLGNLTFYFPSKEHLLAVLIEMLCDFQWKMMKEEADDGISLVLAVCLELMSMTSAAEENETAKDLFISAYTSPITLEIIRKNDSQRAKTVFSEYCPDWTDEQFVEAEALVSGIEYATLMTTKTSSPLDVRISGALDTILYIYKVPEEIRKIKIQKVLSMDYKKIGSRIFDEFKEYIEQVNEQAFNELF
ncbi:MAG: TetR/AcrR family transcriptional regulator [Clostridia bacterium]|nr:TetR/AcrR family transcriptional regulator [Clostridia bacterium]